MFFFHWLVETRLKLCGVFYGRCSFSVCIMGGQRIDVKLDTRVLIGVTGVTNDVTRIRGEQDLPNICPIQSVWPLALSIHWVCMLQLFIYYVKYAPKSMFPKCQQVYGSTISWVLDYTLINRRRIDLYQGIREPVNRLRPLSYLTYCKYSSMSWFWRQFKQKPSAIELTWMYVCLYVRMNVCMHVLYVDVYGWIDWLMDGWMDVCIYVHSYVEITWFMMCDLVIEKLIGLLVCSGLTSCI